MSKYVVMKSGWHAVAFVIPSPVAVRDTRKEANEYVRKQKNPEMYYIRTVKD